MYQAKHEREHQKRIEREKNEEEEQKRARESETEEQKQARIKAEQRLKKLDDAKGKIVTDKKKKTLQHQKEELQKEINELKAKYEHEFAQVQLLNQQIMSVHS
eukprot:TRINITY_DN728_c1_g1_i2.p1 TRINITY_DN728_c1_g1~~TRINITY_DN728_c1_g1_i2.p1  ORF type:complete len:103 (+),score=41.65 TRINITY_DN728_c1_g1_i2:10-318(+)